jgi:hypothetical protein
MLERTCAEDDGWLIVYVTNVVTLESECRVRAPPPFSACRPLSYACKNCTNFLLSPFVLGQGGQVTRSIRHIMCGRFSSLC